jgi:hypothetical protein
MVAEPPQADEYERARRMIDEAVPQHINTWAKIVGLATPTDACINQFRDDVTEALHACMQAHISGSVGDSEKEIRRKVHEEFLALHRARIAAVQKLRDVFAPRWPVSYHEFQVWEDLRPFQHKLEAMAEAMRLEADEWKSTDRGGRPPMWAFNALAGGLVVAYQRATGKTGVGHGARKGKLRAFTESVLPVACKIAEALTERPLAISDSIGDYLHRVASAE